MKSTTSRDRHQVSAQLQNRVHGPEGDETIDRAIAS